MLPWNIYPRDGLKVLAVDGAHIESWVVLRCLNHLICGHVYLSYRRNCMVHICVWYNNPVVRRVVILVKVEVKLKFYLFRVDGLCTVAGRVANKRWIFGVI